MFWLEFIRWLHIIGATVLLGTGAGIAFFMLMANRTNDARLIAHTSGTVIKADYLFTASAVIAQPVTGALLAWQLAWPLTEGWIVVSLVLYVLVGLFWLPVVRIQHELGRLARLAAESDAPLPERYHRLFRVWFLCGFPAFFGVLAIIWLMIARPSL